MILFCFLNEPKRKELFTISYLDEYDVVSEENENTTKYDLLISDNVGKEIGETIGQVIKTAFTTIKDIKNEESINNKTNNIFSEYEPDLIDKSKDLIKMTNEVSNRLERKVNNKFPEKNKLARKPTTNLSNDTGMNDYESDEIYYGDGIINNNEGTGHPTNVTINYNNTTVRSLNDFIMDSVI